MSFYKLPCLSACGEDLCHLSALSLLIPTESFLSNQRKSRSTLFLRASLLESTVLLWVHVWPCAVWGGCSTSVPQTGTQGLAWLSYRSSPHPSQGCSSVALPLTDGQLSRLLALAISQRMVDKAMSPRRWERLGFQSWRRLMMREEAQE